MVLEPPAPGVLSGPSDDPLAALFGGHLFPPRVWVLRTKTQGYLAVPGKETGTLGLTVFADRYDAEDASLLPAFLPRGPVPEEVSFDGARDLARNRTGSESGKPVVALFLLDRDGNLLETHWLA